MQSNRQWPIMLRFRCHLHQSCLRLVNASYNSKLSLAAYSWSGIPTQLSDLSIYRSIVRVVESPRNHGFSSSIPFHGIKVTALKFSQDVWISRLQWCRISPTTYLIVQSVCTFCVSHFIAYWLFKYFSWPNGSVSEMYILPVVRVDVPLNKNLSWFSCPRYFIYQVLWCSGCISHGIFLCADIA